MDLDVVEKNARAVLAFKAELETLLPEVRKTISDVTLVASEIEGVRAILMPALAKLEAMKPDIEAVVADITEIKGTLGPALAWIAEQQKAVEAAKAAATGAQNANLAEIANKTPAGKPTETHAAKPLEHIAEVEASLDEPTARSESETDVG